MYDEAAGEDGLPFVASAVDASVGGGIGAIRGGAAFAAPRGPLFPARVVAGDGAISVAAPANLVEVIEEVVERRWVSW